MATIRLQNINGNLFPTDAVSKETLIADFGIERIPGARFFYWSPKIVRKGHKMAITGDISDIDL